MWYSPYAVFLEFGVFSYILGNVRDNLEVFLEIVIGDTYLFRFSNTDRDTGPCISDTGPCISDISVIQGPLASSTFSSSIRT